MTYAFKDLTGQRFGRLLVLERTNRSKNESVIWRCLCDCGTYKDIKSHNLVNTSTKSCGCYGRECLIARNSTTETLSNRAVRTYYNKYRYDSTQRQLTFELSIDEFRTLIKQPCYYCGTLSNTTTLTVGMGMVKLRANGIDRLDSYIGYTLNNCVGCCSQCNYGKRQLSVTEYIDHCKRVAEHHKEVIDG